MPGEIVSLIWCTHTHIVDVDTPMTSIQIIFDFLNGGSNTP